MKTRDVLVGVGIGAGLMLVVNQLRWSVFPISGGPIGINRILGGPPDDVLRIAPPRG